MGRNMIKIGIDRLKEGMILGKNVYDSSGNILLSSGIKIRDAFMKKVEEHGIYEVFIINNSGSTLQIDNEKLKYYNDYNN